MRLLFVLAALAPLVAALPTCNISDENVLTSKDCPTECAEYPCVVYSPRNKGMCYPHSMSGVCFEVRGATADCNVTYQCLRKISKFDSRTWQLSLVNSTYSDTIQTTAPVTQIKDVKYPTSISIVEVIGGLGLSVRGDVKNIKLDESFFATPDSVTRFYLSDLNLRPFLSTVDLSNAKWQSISFRNTNLEVVPASLRSLSPQYIDLSKNFITAINDSKPFLDASTIILNENLITNFTIDLPDVQRLNLSSNPLDTIPDSIFRMNKLQILSMIDCNLTNLHLTEEQFTFLDQRTVLEVNAVAATCSTGFILREFTNSKGAVCLPGVLLGPEVIDNIESGGSGSLSGSELTDTSERGGYRSITGSQMIDNRESGGSGSLSAAQVIDYSRSRESGVVAGIAAGVVVIAAVSFFIFRLRNPGKDAIKNGAGGRSNTSTVDRECETGSDGPSYVMVADDMHKNTRRLKAEVPGWWKDDTMLSYCFDSRKLSDVRILGSNASHVLWLVNDESGNQRLVSKRLVHAEDNQSQTKILQLVAEAKIASTLRYRSIVPFVGVAWTNNTDLQVLYDYMPNGDLNSFLAQTDASTLAWLPTKLQLAIDVIEALVYTHSFNPPLVHRDLKASNVLLDEDWRAKLGDFGCARVESESGTMTTSGIGSGRWLAPEVLQGSTSYGTPCDIYSFGVLLCELDTHAVPYVEEAVGASSESALLGRVACGELRPGVSVACPMAIRQLAEACLSFDPASRPNALQVAHELRVLLQRRSFAADDKAID